MRRIATIILGIIAIVGQAMGARTWQTAGGSIRVNRSGDTYVVRFAFNAALDGRLSWNLAGTTLNPPMPALMTALAYVPAETAEGAFAGAAATFSPNFDVGDDIAPQYYSATYIGGGHGANMVAEVTVASHDKTAVDVGSLWTDDAAKSWCLIRIVSATKLQFLSSFTTTNDNFVPAATSVTGNLTHASGGTNTAGVTVASQTLVYLSPAISRVKKMCLLDGVLTPRADGWYACDSVDFVEEYEILDPAAVRAWLVSNVGSNPAPDWSRDLAAVAYGARVINRYHVGRNGAVTLDGGLYAAKQLNGVQIGGTQAGRLNTPTSGSLYYYMPGTADFAIGGNSYTFGTGSGQLMNSLADAIQLTQARWADANTPPARCIMYRVTEAGARDYTWSIGYDTTVGQGVAATRAALVTGSAIGLPSTSTRKLYPRLQYLGNLTAGTAWTFRAHRAPDDPSDLPAACIGRTLYQVGTDWMLTLDFNAAYTGTIALPPWLDGRDVTVTAGSGTVSTPTAGGVTVNMAAAGSLTLRLAAYPPAADVRAGRNRGDGTAGTGGVRTTSAGAFLERSWGR